MFGKKTDDTVSSTRTSNSLLHNSLVKGSLLEGNVTSDNDFRIDGEFVGNLKCTARVIIGPTGEFRGEINCENAIIEGRFHGQLHIRGVLEVREGAIIEGDVDTNKLVVQSGSVFDVKCTMGEKTPSNLLTSDDSVLTEISNGQIQ